MIWLGCLSRDFPFGRGSSSSTRPRRSRDFSSGSRGSSSSTRPRHSCRSVLCAPARSHRMDSARAARRRRPHPSRTPPPVLAPPVAAALHPPAAATTEVRTGDLCALRGNELRAPVSSHNDELHSSKQQGDSALALKPHVTSVCFICLRGMLQGFRMNVAKVDRDVACVATVIHVCCKRLFSMLYPFFQTYVVNVFI